MVKMAISNPGIPGFVSPIEAYTNFVTYISSDTTLDYLILFGFPWLAIVSAVAVRYVPSDTKSQIWSQGFLIFSLFGWALNSFNMLLVEINSASFVLEIGGDPYESVLMRTGFLFVTINVTWILLFVLVGLIVLIPRRKTLE
ncbi:MAG: hypothetical protein RL431_934 [Actinomycetota bacterium]